MKLHRKIKHNEKLCGAHDLGSYAQGQGCSQVRGQNLVSAITQKRKCVAYMIKVPTPKVKVTIRSKVKLCLKLY